MGLGLGLRLGLRLQSRVERIRAGSGFTIWASWLGWVEGSGLGSGWTPGPRARSHTECRRTGRTDTRKQLPSKFCIHQSQSRDTRIRVRIRAGMSQAASPRSTTTKDGLLRHFRLQKDGSHSSSFTQTGSASHIDACCGVPGNPLRGPLCCLPCHMLANEHRFAQRSQQALPALRHCC